MSTLDEQLTALLSNGSKELLAALAKMSGVSAAESKSHTPRNGVKERRALEEHPPYINATTVCCALCGSVSTTHIVMTYKPDLQGFTTGYSVLPCEEAPPYPTRKLHIRADSCASCTSVLESLPKEYLVKMLITRANKLSAALEFNALETLARRATSLD